MTDAENAAWRLLGHHAARRAAPRQIAKSRSSWVPLAEAEARLHADGGTGAVLRAAAAAQDWRRHEARPVSTRLMPSEKKGRRANIARRKRHRRWGRWPTLSPSPSGAAIRQASAATQTDPSCVMTDPAPGT